MKTAPPKRPISTLNLSPGTDAALALGIMHVLLKKDLLDHRFIAEETIGFDRFKPRLEAYEPQRVAQITGVPAHRIEDLAIRYGPLAPLTSARAGDRHGS
jgi:anaerobic selenocysteine-containing dehydrogenase